MKKTNKKIIFIFIRYLIILALVLSLPFIYQILKPLTLYPVFYLLKLFFENVILIQDLIIINFKSAIQLIPACIAGSAYLLLLILNLSLPMKPLKRAYTLLFSLSLLFIINLIRLLSFSILYYFKTPFIDFTHKFFWIFISTIIVVLIWLLTIKIFKIKEKPFYSDLKYIKKLI